MAAAPGSSRLTTEGRVVLLLAGGFGMGALNTGTNLLYLVTALLAAVLWANHRLGRRALGALRVRRSAPDPGVVGGPLALKVEVAAEGAAVGVPVSIEERAPDGWLEEPPRALALELPRDERATARVLATCLRRGRVTLPGARLSTTAPFGLVERWHEVDDPLEVLVLPRVQAVRAGALDARAVATEALARRVAFTQERRDVVRGLRDLRPGDDVRAVHWRSSARRGALLVKEFERTAPQDAVVLLHLPASGSAGAAEDEALEAAVTLAASLVAHLVRAGERVTLGIAGAGEPIVVPTVAGAIALRRAMEALALAGPGDADLVGLETAARRVAGDARVLLVTTAPAPPAGGSAGLVARARRFVVRGEADLAGLLREVAA